MSVSSGTASMFAAVAFFIAAASGGAYGLKHKDEIKRLVAEFSGRDAAVTATAETGAKTNNADEANTESDDGGDVTLRAGDSGHFETAAEINGRDVEVMVDTGATMVALTYEDAERAGIYLKEADFTHSVSTANGTAKVAPVEIGTVAIGSITVRNVKGAVAERGKLHKTLLGMSFLAKLSRVEMRKQALVLHE
jgi:aspartyl protease family protein